MLAFLSESSSALHALELVFGFWLFVCSPSFRRNTLARWRGRGWIGKACIPLEVLVFTIAGLLPVLALLLAIGIV
jgi:hypothetical protein